MHFIKLDTFDTINKLVKLCDRYKGDTDIDVSYGRYIVDGASVLGVTSLLGNIVTVEPIIKDPQLVETFFTELKEIVVWQNKEV